MTGPRAIGDVLATTVLAAALARVADIGIAADARFASKGIEADELFADAAFPTDDGAIRISAFRRRGDSLIEVEFGALIGNDWFVPAATLALLPPALAREVADGLAVIVHQSPLSADEADESPRNLEQILEEYKRRREPEGDTTGSP